jgi:hypothetical protein
VKYLTVAMLIHRLDIQLFICVAYTLLNCQAFVNDELERIVIVYFKEGIASLQTQDLVNMKQE